jgi:hypothetical protein
MTDALSRAAVDPAAALHESAAATGLTAKDLRAAATLARAAAERAKNDGTRRMFAALAQRVADGAEALAAHERGEANPRCEGCKGTKRTPLIDTAPGYREVAA